MEKSYKMLSLNNLHLRRKKKKKNFLEKQSTHTYLKMVGSGVQLSTAFIFTAKGLFPNIWDPSWPVVLSL